MRYNKKIICLVLTLSMIVGFGMPVEFNSMSKVEAKKVSKPVLNKKKVTISLKTDATNTTTLKVKKASKKVTWKTSNKKIAVVKKVTGKKKQNAVIKAKAEGKCTIIAMVGKKKLSCTVTVKRVTGTSSAENAWIPTTNRNIVTMDVVSAVASGKAIDITVKFYNGTEDDMNFGDAFTLERWENNHWVKIESVEGTDSSGVRCIPPQQEREIVFSMEAKEDFVSGKYRIEAPEWPTLCIFITDFDLIVG